MNFIVTVKENGYDGGREGGREGVKKQIYR